MSPFRDIANPNNRCISRSILFIAICGIVGLCTLRFHEAVLRGISNTMIKGSINTDQHEEVQSNLLTGKKLYDSIPKPILVVGMPKAGTTSIFEYFKCGNVKVSHWRCFTTKNHIESLCGALMRDNINKNKDPLYNTGNYDVYAQLDGDAYYPQMDALDEIHEYYPSATFILNLRNITSWVNSITHFTPGKGAYIEKYGMPKQTLKSKSEDELVQIFNEQIDRVRRFVLNYPSHKLVEVTIEDSNAGKIMQDSFGIKEKCWGHANVNANIHNDESNAP